MKEMEVGCTEGSHQGKAEQFEFKLVGERMHCKAWAAWLRCVQAVYKCHLQLVPTRGG